MFGGDEQIESLRKALQISPDNVPLRQLLADSLMGYGRFEEAEQGLAHDPEHVGCTNLRAMALVKLGRREDAGVTIEAALAKDPDNAVTHANQGWALLHQGDHVRALEHFREALRLDPELEWAQEGVVEALKARNILYSLMLRYFLWMARLDARVRWGVIIGGVFGYRLLRSIARTQPSLAPWITPVLVAYVLFVLLTWVADPLFNLVLRLDRFGRLVLSRDQVMASNFVGGSILLALVAGVAWLATRQDTFLLCALLFGGLILPISGTFQCHVGWPRNAMAAYTALVGATGLAAVALSFADPRSKAIGILLVVSVLGVVLSGWIANALMTVTPKR